MSAFDEILNTHKGTGSTSTVQATDAGPIVKKQYEPVLPTTPSAPSASVPSVQPGELKPLEVPLTREQKRAQRRYDRLTDYARQEGIVAPDADPTAEDLRQARKERRDKLFASLGDGIQALSNLYFTTQYAPSSYNPKYSGLRQTQVNYDRMRSQREKARKDALAEKIAAANIGRDQIALALQQDRWNWQKDRDKAEDERKEQKHGLEMIGLGHRNRRAEADADAAETKAGRADEYEQSRIAKNKAAASASYARANAAGGGNKYYGEFRGKKYTTRADYEKAVLDAAREAGVDIYDTEVTEKNWNGTPRKERRVKRSIAAIAAEVGEEPGKFDIEKFRRQDGKNSGNSELPPLD